MTAKQPSSRGALVLLWLAGNGLRLTILAVPPILALIILDLKLSGTEVGVLNAIPVCLVCAGVGAGLSFDRARRGCPGSGHRAANRRDRLGSARLRLQRCFALCGKPSLWGRGSR